jgi:hypothetical protein
VAAATGGMRGGSSADGKWRGGKGVVEEQGRGRRRRGG